MFNNNIFNSPLEGISQEWIEIRDPRGALSVVQEAGFPIERVFWIYDVPPEAERGGHAHRTCTELLFAVKGSFDVELTYGDEKVNVRLDRPNQSVLIRPMVWCRLHNFSPDFVGVCLASQGYLADGYIHSFEQFLAETKAE